MFAKKQNGFTLHGHKLDNEAQTQLHNRAFHSTWVFPFLGHHTTLAHHSAHFHRMELKFVLMEGKS